MKFADGRSEIDLCGVFATAPVGVGAHIAQVEAGGHVEEVAIVAGCLLLVLARAEAIGEGQHLVLFVERVLIVNGGIDVVEMVSYATVATEGIEGVASERPHHVVLIAVVVHSSDEEVG